MRTGLLAVFLAAWAGTARAQGRIECSTVASRILHQPIRYCAFLPPSYDAAAPAGTAARRYPALYDLHGLGDNELSLINTGAWSLIQDLRAERNEKRYVVSVEIPSYGHVLLEMRKAA